MNLSMMDYIVVYYIGTTMGIFNMNIDYNKCNDLRLPIPSNSTNESCHFMHAYTYRKKNSWHSSRKIQCKSHKSTPQAIKAMMHAHYTRP